MVILMCQNMRNGDLAKSLIHSGGTGLGLELLHGSCITHVARKREEVNFSSPVKSKLFDMLFHEKCFGVNNCWQQNLKV